MIVHSLRSTPSERGVVTPVPGAEDYLLIGDLFSAGDESQLRRRRVGVIINLSNHTEDDEYIEFPGIEYHHIRVEDRSSVPMGMHFRNTHSVIASAKNRGVTTLVHCREGVSRSVSVVLSHLIQSGQTLHDAYLALRAARWPQQYCAPNHGFWKQLMELEQSVFGTNESTMTYAEYRRLG